MPVSAVLAAIATWAPFGIGAAVGSLSLFNSFLVRTALGLGLNILSKAAIGTPGAGGFSIGGESGAALDHQIIYGRVKVGGARVYDSTTGAKNKYLHRILAFAGHEISSFEEIYLNEDKITFGTGSNYVYRVQYRFETDTDDPRFSDQWDSDEYVISLPVAPENFFIIGDEHFSSTVINKLKTTEQISSVSVINGVRIVSRTRDDETTVSNQRFKGVVKFKKYLGTDTQSADTDLIDETSSLALNAGRWTADHKLSGIAYIYTRLQFSRKAFPNGVPTISAVVKGAKVYDPRSGVTEWSDNPALCILDYLTKPYGLNAPLSRVDLESFKTAANVCDSIVNGGTRYTLNGAFTTAASPDTILADMLTSMGGMLWFSQGKWRIKAADWTPAVIRLNEDDLRSGVRLNTRQSRKDLFNTVKGTFKGESSDWQVTDYPQVTRDDFLAADNGVVNTLNMPLNFTVNPGMCRRLARIALFRNREQLVVNASFGARALALSVGDTILLDSKRFGWGSQYGYSDKYFEVLSWSFNLDESGEFIVNLTLRETSTAVYQEGDGAIFELNNTSLPDPFEVVSPSIDLRDELRRVNGRVTGVLLADVTADSDIVERVQVQFKKSSNSAWRNMGVGDPGIYEAFSIVDGYYDVRARSFNNLGIESNWTYRTKYYATPFADPPTAPTDFSGNIVGDKLILTWEAPDDLDLSHYRVRYSSATTGATYANAVNVASKVSFPSTQTIVPARTGTYFLKAFDRLGNASPAASFVVFEDVGDFIPKNVVATLNQFPSYAGTKTNLTLGSDVIGPYLTPTSVGTVGYYNFASYFDLGIKQTFTARMKFDNIVIDVTDRFDGRLGNFDEAEGRFDGDPKIYDFVNIQGQVSTTNDNPAGSPTWSAWRDIVEGSLTARAVRFRVAVVSKDKSVAPTVRNLTAIVDMPDRIVSGNDITFTGSTTVTFAQPFRAAPAVSIDLTNLNPGQRYAITSKTKYGFTVSVYDSQVDGLFDTPTIGNLSLATNSVTMDYVAKGYGKEI